MKISKIFLGLEKKAKYSSSDTPFVVGVSKYSINKLINIIREFNKRSFTYYKLFGESNITDGDTRKFWFNDKLINKYTSQMSDSFEIWIPTEEAPLLIDHTEQDLRILISPMIRK